MVFRFEKVLQKISRLFPHLKLRLRPQAPSSLVPQMSGYTLSIQTLNRGLYVLSALSLRAGGRQCPPSSTVAGACPSCAPARGRERSPEQGSPGSTLAPWAPASPTKSELYSISFISFLFHKTTLLGSRIVSMFLMPSSFYRFWKILLKMCVRVPERPPSVALAIFLVYDSFACLFFG